MGARLWVGAALVALAGAGVAAFVLPSPARPTHGEEAARAFVAAWERHLLGTYVVELAFTRTLADGRVLEGRVVLAQRPPDRLEVGLGSVEGRVDGQRVRCATRPGSGLRCFPGRPAPAYRDEVADELDRLAPYVLGDRPLYRVTQAADDGRSCFALALALDHPSPPYGQAARFCFDPRSGAPTLTEVRRPEATDRRLAVAVRTAVADRDFEVPADAGDLPGA